MKQMNIGMYYPVETYLHKLDARVKVIATVMVVTLLFFSSDFLSYTLIACFLVGLFLSARLPVKLLSSMRALRLVLGLTFLFSLFLTPGEAILFEWQFIEATVEGLFVGLILVVRVMLMLLTTTLLTLTTTPFSLTQALVFLLSPLQKLRLPVAEGALMINLALRFIPTIMEEKDRIMNAQKARGASFEVDGVLKKAKSMVSILIPLIIASFKRADDLALAMEARYFKIGATRSNYRMLQMTCQDYLALSVMLAFSIGMLAFGG